MENRPEEEDGVEHYGDASIASADAPIPSWLKYSYLLWIVVGLVCYYLYWNGSWGWLDRGYWQQLQRAANTVYPFTTDQKIE